MKTQLFIKDFESLVHHVRPLDHEELMLIGIDGRPCSGKTSVALQLAQHLNAQIMHIDEFFIPQSKWPVDAKPSFPFFYIDYDRFINGLQKLASGVACTYLWHDWQTGLSDKPKTVTPHGPIIIEGVSALHHAISQLYHRAIWIASELRTENDALAAREEGKNAHVWQNIYIPSVNLYTIQKPWDHADIMYAGRGIGWNSECN